MIKESVILASSSPRRRDLLDEFNYNFKVIPSDVEETNDLDIAPEELTTRNALLKASDVAKDYPNDVVIGADTLVFLECKALGKPEDSESALEMLLQLQGRSHSVVTGVALVRGADQITFFDSTEVVFRPFNKQTAIRYHELINPLDKAGAYAAQEYSEVILEKMIGSYSNVVGLPMEKLNDFLPQFIQSIPREL